MLFSLQTPDLINKMMNISRLRPHLLIGTFKIGYTCLLNRSLNVRTQAAAQLLKNERAEKTMSYITQPRICC